MSHYRKPCFEGNYPAEVENCLENTKPGDCSYLCNGGSWEDCESGKLNPLLEHYRRGECKTPGEAIRRLRQYAGLSLRKAAEDLKVDAVVLGKWERDK